MSIQQSVNQLLGTSTIAAGLYAHQPNVAQRRTNALEAQGIEASLQPKLERVKAIEGASEAVFSKRKDVPNEFLRATIRGDEDITSLYTDIRSGYERLAELRPDRAWEYSGESAHSKVKQDTALNRIDVLQKQLVQRQADREAQRTTRAAILEGTRPTPPKPREVIK